MDPKYISIADVADRLGVPASWLRRLVDAGEIPFLQIGTRRRFNPEAVEQAVNEWAMRCALAARAAAADAAAAEREAGAGDLSPEEARAPAA